MRFLLEILRKNITPRRKRTTNGAGHKKGAALDSYFAPASSLARFRNESFDTVGSSFVIEMNWTKDIFILGLPRTAV
ncbi:hypothetical protein TNCV_1191511 [Trichonephila clavipes]|nr:hypothetical protein TNCV_1191511 [Trichonephila clavipes]